MDLKVVFQGGGARLVTLIAAADAVRELELERGLNVAHVAGVSAGSLAAAMFGSHRSISEQIEILKRIGPSALRSLGKMPYGLFLAMRLLQGKPLLNEAPIFEIIHELFYKYDQHPMTRLSDLRVPTTIIASDLRARRRIDYQHNSNHDLKRIISDSCAIPFAFRTHKSADLIVDGGISSNLPVDVVLGGDSGRDCVIAFKFDDAGTNQQDVTSVSTYVRALLSTAIDASVEVAADRIIAAGGHVCLLPDHFSTLGFQDAIDNGFDGPAYSFAKSQAREGVERILDKHESQKRIYASARPRRTIQEEVYESHRCLMDAFPVREARCATIVVANCLRDPSNPASAISDDIYQIVDYEPQADQIIALRIGIPSGRVLVENGDPCEITINGQEFIHSRQVIVSLDDPENLYGLLRYNLIFLREPLKEKGDFVRALYHSRQRNALRGLKEKEGFEWIRTRNRAETPSPVEDYIVILPNDFPKPNLVDLRQQQNECKLENRIDGFAAMDRAWTRGREMTQDEISTALSDYGLKNLGLGMQAIGWKTINLGPGHFSGVAITRNDSP